MVITGGCVVDQIVSLGDNAAKYYTIDNEYYTGESFFELQWYSGKYGIEILKYWDKLVLDILFLYY